MATESSPPLLPNPGIVIVLTTVASTEAAAKMANALVSSGLAACVNVLAAGRSLYRWQGQLCDDAEVLCVIKTQRQRLEALAARLQDLHPYEVPELLVFDALAASGAYAAWVCQVTNDSASPEPA